LDVFAGTGALGIEALSRGAESVVFVDSSSRSLAVLRRNLSSLELEACCRVLRSGAAAGIRRLGREGQRFDLAFMDPPYDSDLLEPTLRAVVEAGILASEGTVVVETSTRHPVEPVDGLSTIDERRYGDTLITRMRVARP
jgi:16S rRNA (guanine966-N2)-methyltransferase